MRSRPQRTVQPRTVDMKVAGVGMVKVSRFSLDIDTVLKEDAGGARARRQREQQSLLYVSNSGRQVAGRDFQHQDVCQECWDGGELLVCDLCPLGFHLKCLGLQQMPSVSMWHCPHHHCATCLRRVSAATLLFRCECCSHAYCEDCLPAEAAVQGNSKRLEALGYRMQGSACYILCSYDCLHFFEAEIEKPEAASAPHQRAPSAAYLPPPEGEGVEGGAGTGSHKAGTGTGRRKGRKGTYLAGRGAGADAGAEAKSEGGEMEVGTGTDAHEGEEGAGAGAEGAGAAVGAVGEGQKLDPAEAAAHSLTLSVEHALDNCSLADIRARLGLRDAGDAEAGEGGAPNPNLNALRLCARFQSLGEIPNFSYRLGRSPFRVKSLLFKIVTDTRKFMQSLVEGEGAGGGGEGNSASGGGGGGGGSIDEWEGGDLEDMDEATLARELTSYAGAVAGLSPQQLSRVFLHAVSSIARAQRSELFPLSQLLGLCLVTPIIRPKPLPEDVDVATARILDEQYAKVFWEPKFCWIKDYHRQKLEEAITAVLVLPCPQNLLMQKSQQAVLPRNSLSPHCLLYCSRLLQALGERCEDDNNLFFTALAIKQKGVTQVRTWRAEYPLGQASHPLARMQWLLPAARLFVHLRRPFNLEDRGLRQLLCTTYTHFHPPPPTYPAYRPNYPPTSTYMPSSVYGGGAYQGGGGAHMAQRLSASGFSYAYQTPSGQASAAGLRPGYVMAPAAPVSAAVRVRQTALAVVIRAKHLPMTPAHELSVFLQWINTRAELPERAVSDSDIVAMQAAAAASRTGAPTPAPAPDPPKPPAPPVCRFHIPPGERKGQYKPIHALLRMQLPPDWVQADRVEVVRRCECELLVKATTKAAYLDVNTLPHRVARELKLHPEWLSTPASAKSGGEGAAADATAGVKGEVKGADTETETKVANGATAVGGADASAITTATAAVTAATVDAVPGAEGGSATGPAVDTATATSSDAAVPAAAAPTAAPAAPASSGSSSSGPTPPSSSTGWRAFVSAPVRQDMISRVEKMLRLVSEQLGIRTLEDLNAKIQQYELGLIISAASGAEYLDKETLPKRLALLVSEFADFKKMLAPSYVPPMPQPMHAVVPPVPSMPAVQLVPTQPVPTAPVPSVPSMPPTVPVPSLSMPEAPPAPKL
ncbi:hypothetical protein B484DRAFT_106271 [Ochromonadaceae sp. CCMP2298]|nr:hypothetical protein B484DRAFT_106271 [Ochromonadaceae sp. CCMP2298]